MRQMKLRFCVLSVIACLCLVACGMEEISPQKIRDLEYTVLNEKQIPKELLDTITQKKGDVFKLTYEDEAYLYICQGYGEKPSAGYSISVKDAYVTSNAIYFSTNLIGPSENDIRKTQPSCPYIVIKTERQDLTVVFE